MGHGRLRFERQPYNMGKPPRGVFVIQSGCGPGTERLSKESPQGQSLTTSLFNKHGDTYESKSKSVRDMLHRKAARSKRGRPRC